MMKSINKTILIGLFSLFTTFASGQSNLTKQEIADFTERFAKAEGTYQIQVIDSRELPTMEISFIEEIEAARKENEIAYIFLKENMRVKILPLSQIQVDNVEPIEKIVFINSSELK